MISLLIADDHQVLLDGFIAIFDTVNDIEVVCTAHNGTEVLARLESHQVDVVLLDINMPVLNGVETCKKLTKKHPQTKVIALSMYDQQSYFKRMMQYGAQGYLLKNDTAEVIEAAIRSVHNGEVYVSEQMKAKLTSIDYLIGKNTGSDPVISDREREVLQLIADGCTDQEVADRLYLSHHTANSHRKNLLSKMGAKNTAELIKITMEKGII